MLRITSTAQGALPAVPTGRLGSHHRDGLVGNLIPFHPYTSGASQQRQHGPGALPRAAEVRLRRAVQGTLPNEDLVENRVATPEFAPQLTSSEIARGLIRAARPRQWVKNLLVLAAPLAAGTLHHPAVLWHGAVAFMAFSLAASGIYLINDVMDVDGDRAHPTKRNRPIAAGVVSPTFAVGIALVLLTAALVVTPLASLQLLAVVAVYIGVQLAYCYWLKQQPVIDICIVSSGFLLRAIAGAAAAAIPLSQWFLLAAGFGSLFMVAGKRYAEIQLVERTGVAIHKSLDRYSASYLRFVWGLSATVLIMTYGLWAFEIRGAHHSTVWSAISIVPFVVAVLRYAVDVDGGKGGEPEEIAMNDRVLQTLGIAWLLTIVLAVYM